MTVKTIEKATLAIAAAVLVIAVVGYSTLTSPVAAQTATSTTASSGVLPSDTQTSSRMAGIRAMHNGALRQGGPMMSGGRAFAQNQVNVSVGQTFTITITQGEYYIAGTPVINGTASGTLTFRVTGKLASGYTLSLSSGSVTVAGTTYAITSGTAQMNHGASGISGQGATSPTGQFILRAGAWGSFVGSTGLVFLDLQAGSSEYLVGLTGSLHS
jgi:hypothetical protein